MLDFGKELDFHATALAGLVTRQRVIAHNIANQSTPGYHAKSVRFEEVMASALSAGRAQPGLQFPVERAQSAGVDLELELMQLEKNRVVHEIVSRAAGHSLRGLLAAVRSR